MAWVAQRSDGSIASVGFDKAQAPMDEDITLVDIADELAIRVMEGSINMQWVLSGPPAQQPSPALLTKRLLGNRNPAYPSMMGQIDADALMSIAHSLPPGSIGVEIGSRLGGSAKLLLEHAPQIKRLYCIDSSWASDSRCGDDVHLQWILEHYAIDPATTLHDYARTLLKDYAAARLLAAKSPYDISWWTEPVDFIFEDSRHTNPQLRDNLNFWVPLVRPGGVISGHDYIPDWPDVVQEVDQLRDRLGAELHVQGTVWWMIKP